MSDSGLLPAGGISSSADSALRRGVGVLLSELALELLAALPLGWVAGYALSAFIVELIRPETFCIPLIIGPRTDAYATLIVLIAGAAAHRQARRPLRARRLDRRRARAGRARDRISERFRRRRQAGGDRARRLTARRQR
jgi:hypothetical protein